MSDYADSADAPAVLNIGCGPRGPSRIHDYFPPGVWREIRLDIDPRNEPDLLASMTDMSVVADASVDAVWSSHSLEHLERHQIVPALKECLRVLKPGGILKLFVPDLQSIAPLIADDKLHQVLYQAPAGPITVHDVVYGHSDAIASGQSYMAHRSGFTPTLLGQNLVEAGFHTIVLQRAPYYELEATAQRQPQDAEGAAPPAAGGADTPSVWGR